MGNILSSAFEKLLFHPVTVTDAERISNDFLLAALKGEGLQGVTVVPGQTVQFLVGDLTKRAYTPMDHDPQAGSARFLFHLHGGGPGSEWATQLEKGKTCKVMRPKNSIDFTKAEGASLLFGDETSFAAAQALQQCQKDRTPARLVFEVSSPAISKNVTERLGLENVALVAKKQDGSHIDTVVQEMKEEASRQGSVQCYFTGQALSIQSIRKGLKSAGFSLKQSVVKAYWSPGKTGMD